MKQVSILVPESAVMEAVADPRYMFTAANQFLMSAGKAPLFAVELVGQNKEVRLHDGVFSVHADKVLAEVKRTDLVVIPALFGDMKQAVEKNQDIIPWIVQQHQQGAEVASLCVGAFLLASTGLLDGKKMFYPLGFYNEFRETFPRWKWRRQHHHRRTRLVFEWRR
nr:DJ-1/PfpI family protein [Haliscomenobacter sp.]